MRSRRHAQLRRAGAEACCDVTELSNVRALDGRRPLSDGELVRVMDGLGLELVGSPQGYRGAPGAIGPAPCALTALAGGRRQRSSNSSAPSRAGGGAGAGSTGAGAGAGAGAAGAG